MVHTKVAVATLLTLIIAVTVNSSAQTTSSPPPTFAPELFGELEYRMVGPSRGGRVTAVAGHRTQPSTFYMGATGGGVWKTTDYGQTWHNISDG